MHIAFRKCCNSLLPHFVLQYLDGNIVLKKMQNKKLPLISASPTMERVFK